MAEFNYVDRLVANYNYLQKSKVVTEKATDNESIGHFQNYCNSALPKDQYEQEFRNVIRNMYYTNKKSFSDCIHKDPYLVLLTDAMAIVLHFKIVDTIYIKWNRTEYNVMVNNKNQYQERREYKNQYRSQDQRKYENQYGNQYGNQYENQGQRYKKNEEKNLEKNQETKYIRKADRKNLGEKNTYSELIERLKVLEDEMIQSKKEPKLETNDDKKELESKLENDDKKEENKPRGEWGLEDV